LPLPPPPEYLQALEKLHERPGNTNVIEVTEANGDFDPVRAPAKTAGGQVKWLTRWRKMGLSGALPAPPGSTCEAAGYVNEVAGFAQPG
jgi:hypothetical protein